MIGDLFKVIAMLMAIVVLVYIWIAAIGLVIGHAHAHPGKAAQGGMACHERICDGD